MTLLEICVDDVAGLRAAERAGADRVELCADLLEGGITPSIGMVRAALAAAERVAVHVLIRPRGGDFAYDPDEADAMVADIEAMKDLPRTVPLGFVVNALTPALEVDEPVTRRLVEASAGHAVTFSRAFDEVPGHEARLAAADLLASLGVDRILTGGGPGAAVDNLPDLRRLVSASAGRLQILAAGGIRSHNVADIVEASGVTEVHQRAPREVDGRLRTDEAEVRDTLAALMRGAA